MLPGDGAGGGPTISTWTVCAVVGGYVTARA